MSTKRKPPTLQQKKEEVNKKALIWIGSTLVGIVILFIILFIITKTT